MDLDLQIVNKCVNDTGSRTRHHSIRGNDLRHSLVVKLDNVVACRASHEEPASPDKKTTNERDRRIRLRVVLHQVVVVYLNQLLCLLVI